jgi:hypothetical protein
VSASKAPKASFGHRRRSLKVTPFSDRIKAPQALIIGEVDSAKTQLKRDGSTVIQTAFLE